MSLVGSLEDLGLGDILQIVSLSRKSGILCLRCEGGEGRIVLEEGMVRFEAYRVIGEDALIIHEVFDDTSELKFHLTKGTADRYKKDIDEIAQPERYFFRGPVSWTIRTYSKFMHLPATYSSRGSHYTAEGGSSSDGRLGGE